MTGQEPTVAVFVLHPQSRRWHYVGECGTRPHDPDSSLGAIHSHCLSFV